MLPTNNTGEIVVDVITTFRLPSVTPTDAYFNTDPTFGTDTSSEKPETVPPTVDKEPEGSNAIYAIVLLLLIPLGLLIYMSVRRQKASEDPQAPTPDIDVGPAPSVEMPFVVVPDETHVAIDVHTPVEVVRVRRLSGWGTSVDPPSPPKIRKVSTGSVTSKKSTRSNKSQRSNKSEGSGGK
ncbi:unnamed protein product [Lymnaea stagnalis]|uniref:Uncharacterized protein n=1 Tax=Lymnaea stagnalis TaxID=6523 RepID=A0AAV2HZR4_LYMST